MECKYAQQIKNGSQFTVQCNAGAGVCAHLRYCMSERCYKNSSSYNNCPAKKRADEAASQKQQENQ